MATPASIKRIMRSDAVQRLLGYLIAAYFQAVRRTSRIDRAKPPVDGPHILALWHGRLIMLPLLRNGEKPLVALISGHRDGQIVSRAGALFGILAATGSSSRGGMRAVREMIRFARDGHSLFVTPDGPRGPRMHADSGIVDLARLTGLPIVPATISARHGVNLDTWDRFLLPRPFTTVFVRWGAPIRVTADNDKAETTARLEEAMIRLQDEADRAAGRPRIERG